MSEIKWIKIAVDMPDDEEMKLIDSMSYRDVIFYVLIRLFIQAGKTNAKGKIFLSEKIPYTVEMLAIIFNRPIEVIEAAIKVLKALNIIEIDENNFINIVNWEKYQNIEGMEKVREQNRKRAEKFRNKNKNKAESERVDERNYDSNVDSDNIEDINNNNNDEYLNDDTNNDTDNNILNDNVMVTEQNKNEIEIENKTNKDTEKNPAFEIFDYIKKVSGRSIKVSLINKAVSEHGINNVKLAVDEAIKVNKIRMNYINGILKNWKREGYPTEAEFNKQRNCLGTIEGKKLSFINFEPREYDYDALEKALLKWD